MMLSPAVLAYPSTDPAAITLHCQDCFGWAQQTAPEQATKHALAHETSDAHLATLDAAALLEQLWEAQIYTTPDPS